MKEPCSRLCGVISFVAGDINSVRVLFLSVSIPMFSVLLETAEEKLRKPLTYAGRSITRRRQSGRDSQAIGGEIQSFLARPDFTIVPSENPCCGRVHYVPIRVLVVECLLSWDQSEDSSLLH